MKIKDVEMQYQSDPRFANEIMTAPAWQKNPDKVGDYFCYNTAKLNAYNLFFKGKKPFMNIKELNDAIKKARGYLYIHFYDLYKGDLNKVKASCFQKESYVIHEIVNAILEIKSEEKKYTGRVNTQSGNEFYIIKTPYKESGHFSLIVKDDKTYLDSYDCKLKIPEVYLYIIKLTF